MMVYVKYVYIYVYIYLSIYLSIYIYIYIYIYIRGCTALYFYRDGFVFQAHRLLYHST